MTEAEIKEKAFAAMKRFIKLGQLLPPPGELDLDDAAAVAEAKLIIAEADKTRKQIEDLCAQSALPKIGDLPPKQREAIYRRIERSMKRHAKAKR